MKYVHTNIITDDWKRLAEFYIQAFACKMTLPQRNLSGEWLAQATGVTNAHIRGAHLRLPGWGKQGPTLEIFQYDNNEAAAHPLSNRKGLGHIAFEVEDVETALEKALAFGGKRYGTIASQRIEPMGLLTIVYMRDPDGNIIELQNWSKTTDTTTSTPNTALDQNPTSKQLEDSYENAFPSPPINANANKRAYLDALQQDLDATEQSVQDSKALIKASKEELHRQKQETNRALEYTDNDHQTIPKSKQELLQELKEEVAQEEQNKQPLPPTLPSNTPPNTSPKPSLPTPSKSKPFLSVELKIKDTVQPLKLTDIPLGMPSTTLAQNLQRLTTNHPQNKALSFLEYLGKQYKADLVPLVKNLTKEQSPAEQEKAWILIERLKGSLNHLLGQCQQQKALLENVGLEQIELSPTDFVDTYTSLMNIVMLAEQEAASHIRWSYTIEA